jgi:hypothetical protein
MITYTRTLIAISILASLVACGGGSGDSSSSAGDTGNVSSGGNSRNTSNPPAISIAGNLWTVVPPNTYAPGSDSASYFTEMNAARIAAGAGAIAQSTLLDTSASAHAEYEIANLATQGLSHDEITGSTGYTGDTPDTRIKSAGYAAALDGELIGGTDYVGGMLDSVNHATIFLGSMTSVGFGTASGQYGEIVVADLASTSTIGNVPASGKLVTYPYAAQVSVPTTFVPSGEGIPTSEIPSTQAGQPVLVGFRNADFVNYEAAHGGAPAVAVTAFELTDASGNVVPSTLVAQTSGITGPQGSPIQVDALGEMSEGFVVLVPLSPLSPGQTYTVSFAMTMAGTLTPLAPTAWSFTTAQQ